MSSSRAGSFSVRIRIPVAWGAKTWAIPLCTPDFLTACCIWLERSVNSISPLVENDKIVLVTLKGVKSGSPLGYCGFLLKRFAKLRPVDLMWTTTVHSGFSIVKTLANGRGSCLIFFDFTSVAFDEFLTVGAWRIRNWTIVALGCMEKLALVHNLRKFGWCFRIQQLPW